MATVALDRVVVLEDLKADLERKPLMPRWWWFDPHPRKRSSEMILFLKGARYHPHAPHMQAISTRKGRTWMRQDLGGQ